MNEMTNRGERYMKEKVIHGQMSGEGSVET